MTTTIKPKPARRMSGVARYRTPAGATMTQQERYGYLKLDFNEAAFPPSPLVRKAIADTPLHLYPDMEAAWLREALADYTSRGPGEIRVWNGSDAALRALCWSYLNEGDAALLREPVYAQFGAFVKQVGADILAVAGDDAFDPCSLMYDAGLLRCQPQMAYIVNPNNPTGVCYNLATISRWLCENSSTLFVIDEAYHEYAPSLTAAPLLDSYNNLVVVRSFSKAFALASLRVGYTLSSPEIAETLDAVRNGKDVSSTAQIAALVALEDLAYMQRARFYTINTRVWTAYQLRDMGLEVHETPANFILIKTPDAEEATRRFMEHGVLVRDRGYLHQLGGFVRVTIGTYEQMEQFVAVARKVLAGSDVF